MNTIILNFGADKLASSFTVVLIALAVQRFTDRPRIRHGVWLAVLVTMLMPALLRVELGWLPFFANAKGDSGSADLQSVLSATSGPAAGLLSTSPATIIVLVWLTGSAVVLALSVFRALQFHYAVRRSSTAANAALSDLAAAVARELGMRAAPPVLVTSARVSPLVWTRSGKACVVLPASLTSCLAADQLRWMLAHELAHIRRGDHVVRVLEWIAGIAFWWNPATWVARHHLRQAEELCCDELVLSSLSAPPRGYARALVAVADFLSAPPRLRTPALAMRAVSDGRITHLERRIRMIMSGSSTRASSKRGNAAAWALMSLLLPFGAISVGNSQQDKQPTSAMQECERLNQKVQAEVQAGSITAEDARKLTARCVEGVKVKQGDVITVEKEKADVQKAKGEMDKVKLQAYLHELEAAVVAGSITQEQAKVKLAAATGPSGNVSASPAKVDCNKIVIELHAAVEAGKLTAAQALEKIYGACGK